MSRINPGGTSDGFPGIEIDHGYDNACLSAAFRGKTVEIDIGEHWQNSRLGFEKYVDIELTVDEARALRDWLNGLNL